MEDDEETIATADSTLSEVDGETANIVTPRLTEDWDKTPEAIRKSEAAATLIPAAAIIGGDQYTHILPDRWTLTTPDNPKFNELRDIYIKWNLKAGHQKKNKPFSQCPYHKPGRLWLLTFNHPNLEMINIMLRALIKNGSLEKCTVGNEYNTNDGYHVHAFLAFKQPQQYINMINLFPTADIKSDKENATMMHAYCLKDCDDYGRNWYTEASKLPKPKKESARKENCRKLQSGELTLTNLIREQPSEIAFYRGQYESVFTQKYDNRQIPRKVIYIWGPSGSGKSTYVRKNIIPELENEGLHTAYEFNKISYENGFFLGISANHKAIHLEEFRSHIPWEKMLEVIGETNFDVNIKNGLARYQPETVIITSPLAPWEQYQGLQQRQGHDTHDQFMRRISTAIQLGKRKRTDDDFNIEQTWTSAPQAGVPEEGSIWKHWLDMNQTNTEEINAYDELMHTYNQQKQGYKELIAECTTCYDCYNSKKCLGNHSSTPQPKFKN